MFFEILQVLNKVCIASTLNYLAYRNLKMLLSFLPRLMNLHTSKQIKLTCDGVGAKPRLSFTHLHKLSQYVISFGAMSWKLVASISLKYVRSSFYQISDNIKVSTMRC